MGNGLQTAFDMGAKMDSWGESFNYDLWMDAFEKCNLSSAFYANRERSVEERNPWDHLDYGVTKEFLVREYNAALSAVTTPNCREKCAGCGANKYGRGVCFEKR